jgi:ribosomal protein S18 acetylase RimI-like enzyme
MARTGTARPHPDRMQIRPFRPADEAAVIALWRSCELLRPQNDPHQDIRRKRAVGAELFLVGEIDGRLVASVMAGYEGHRGWLNYLAVDPTFRRRGLGRSLVAEAERRLAELGCPKVNLQVRSPNAGAIEFYRRIGYAVDDVVSMGKRLVRDRPDG